jgi:phosphoribosylaminoimidazole-succinocarboxamide synthase
MSFSPDITQVPVKLTLQDVQDYQSSRLDPNDLPGTLTKTYEGKVRKNYFIQSETGKNLIVSEASDRTSAFDIPNLIPQVPYKGKVLDTISKHWAARIEGWGYKTDLVKDPGLIFNSHAAITVREPLETLPIEFVVRRYLTGTTDTSLSSRYFKNGERDYGDFKLKDGLELHSRLDRTILTPTTKEKEDRNVNKAGAVDFILKKAREDSQFNQALDKALSKLQANDKNLSDLSLENPDHKKLLVTRLYEKIEKMVIDVFDRAEGELKGSAVLLIDTKFELGLDKDGEVRFMDELLTPDSSRYWSKQSLEEARKQNQAIVKENQKFHISATAKDLFSKLKFPSSVDKDLMRNIARAKPEEFSAWKTENQDIIEKNKMKTAEEEYQPYKSQFFTDADVQKLANGYLHILKTITSKDLNLNKE